MPAHYFTTHAVISEYDLTFAHVQVVMERHRCNLEHGLPVDELAEIEIFGPNELRDIMSVLSVEAQILDEELCLRVQQWHVFPPGEGHRALDPRRLGICNHVSTFGGLLGPLFRCKLQHENLWPNCTTCHPYLACVQCGVEFHVQQAELGSDGSAIVVTKWMNFGRGITPTDEHWRSKLFGYPYIRESPIRKA